MHYRYVEDQQTLIEACETYGEDLEKLYDEAYVPWVIVNRCYNLETGELTTSDLPYAKVIAENTYVYWDQEKEQYVIRKADNTEMPAVGLQKAYQLYLVNQKLWRTQSISSSPSERCDCTGTWYSSASCPNCCRQLSVQLGKYRGVRIG